MRENPAITDHSQSTIVERTCDTCSMPLPLNANYYDRDNADEQGFKRVCKACRSKQKQDTDDRVIDERLKRFDAVSIRLLETALDSGSMVPHHAEIFQELVRIFGGVSGYAGHFMSHFLATQIGSGQRTKMFALMQKMSEKVTESGVATVPLEMLSDEDLDRMHKQQLMNLLRQAEKVKKIKDIARDDTTLLEQSSGLGMAPEEQSVEK